MAFKFTAFAGVLVAAQLAGAALAQTAPPPTSPPPSAERLKLARDVFEAQGGLKNASAAIDRVLAGMPFNSPGGSGAVSANGVQMRQVMEQSIHKFLPQVLDAQAEAYAEVFDEQQLRDILAFYQSPTGQVMRDKLPEISAKAGAAMGKLMPALMEDVLERVCSQTSCTDQQQKTLDALKQRLASTPAP
jgi:hypothetical protein